MKVQKVLHSITQAVVCFQKCLELATKATSPMDAEDLVNGLSSPYHW